jgi:hypothetical protein
VSPRPLQQDYLTAQLIHDSCENCRHLEVQFFLNFFQYRPSIEFGRRWQLLLGPIEPDRADPVAFGRVAVIEYSTYFALRPALAILNFRTLWRFV